MKIRKLKNKPSRKNPYTYIVLGAAILIGVYFATAYATKLPPFVADTATTEFQDGVNLERTETEESASEALQENPESKLDNEQNDTPSAPQKDPETGKQAANVSLTTAGIYNGTVNAGGMVTNVTEDDGRCTYVFVNGSQRVTKETTTLVNPTSTTCKAVSFSADEFPQSGIWTVTLNYSSAVSQGISNSKEITK